LTIAMLLATTAGEGVNVRIFTLLLGSAVAGLVAGCLVYIATDGAAKKKLAVGILTGFVAFAGAYRFLDSLVPSQTTGLPDTLYPALKTLAYMAGCCRSA
jgi:hypothetical protein